MPPAVLRPSVTWHLAKIYCQNRVMNHPGDRHEEKKCDDDASAGKLMPQTNACGLVPTSLYSWTIY